MGDLGVSKLMEMDQQVATSVAATNPRWYGFPYNASLLLLIPFASLVQAQQHLSVRGPAQKQSLK